MSAGLSPYTIPLTAPSPIFDYRPYRETDAAIGWNASYTESTAWPIVPVNSSLPYIDALPKGVAYRRTHLNGAAVSLSFEGTGFYMCFTASGASYSVTVDGRAIDSSSSNSAAGSPCEKSGAETIFQADDLTLGTHEAVLTLSSAPLDDFRFYGGGFTVAVNTKGQRQYHYR
ncbi:hypothetical protein EXIGLDRAFT_292793 [Exidia glandulosa HHB12029]|uniref:Uncharacterized protein n=1 Tax=Exidia glandulosa HHB12029 TaxID=1314781 RepID=A0A165M1K0_EXIGL|nr:hypothetical protein EXIGLDRAFT_292793 [Exidia glandulosa HHB12029]